MTVVMAAIGTLFEIVGLTLAANGLSTSYREHLNRPIWPDLLGRFDAWFKRRVLRRQPPPQVVQLGVASEGNIASSVQAKLTPAGLSGSPTIEERISRVERYVEILDDQIEGVRTEFSTEVNRLSRETSQKLDLVSDRIQDLDDEVQGLQRLTVGPEGRGLQDTMVGLLLAAMGIVLTVPSIWG